MTSERVSLIPSKKAVARSNAPKVGRSSIVVSIEEDQLVLRLPLVPEKARKPSKSGKTIICASTGGTKMARQLVNEELVPVTINNVAMRVCASAWIPVSTQETETTGDHNDHDDEQS